jgi:hypothetical protein
MKRFLLFVFSILLTFSFAIAQDGINYQGAATDANGDELTNQNISIRASVLSTSANGNLEWEETHSATTDQFGLFNIVIGQGTSTTNGAIALFDDMDWGSANHYLKIEMDATGGTNYAMIGTTQMMSVPYALYAKSAGIDSTAIANIISVNTSIPSHGYQYFNDGSGVNTFIVPDNVFTIEIELGSGAGGDGGDACNFGYAYGGAGGGGAGFRAIINCFPGDTIELHVGADGVEGCGACGTGVGCTCVPCGFVSGAGTNGTSSTLIINSITLLDLSPGEFGTGADASNSTQKIHGTDGSSGTITYSNEFNSSGIFLLSEFISGAYGKIRW